MIRFHCRSTYALTPLISADEKSMRSDCSTILLTAGQESRRTVSMPLASNWYLDWSGRSYIAPTYLFLERRKQGW